MDSLNAFVSGRGFLGFLGLDLSDVLGYWVWSGVGLLRFLVFLSVVFLDTSAWTFKTSWISVSQLS